MAAVTSGRADPHPLEPTAIDIPLRWSMGFPKSAGRVSRMIAVAAPARAAVVIGGCAEW